MLFTFLSIPPVLSIIYNNIPYELNFRTVNVLVFKKRHIAIRNKCLKNHVNNVFEI